MLKKPAVRCRFFYLRNYYHRLKTKIGTTINLADKGYMRGRPVNWPDESQLHSCVHNQGLHSRSSYI